MFCSHCGKENSTTATFCQGCGARLAADAARPEPVMPAASAPPGMPAADGYSDKSKLAAALLAFFLGCFGIHRFYLGHTTIGIIQLVLCVFTCGIIPTIWGWVDMVLILTGSLKDAQGRPLRG